MKDTILIIDDKVKLCKILAQDFENLGYESRYATNITDAINLFLKNEINTVILDLKLGTENGLDVLKKLLNFNSNVPVIMVTGYATIENAVESIKIGAFDYIQKPVNFTKLQKIVENAINISRLKAENTNLKTRLFDSYVPIITKNGQMLELLNRLTKLATTDYPIFLCGESGTGKELVADFIHINSPRSSLKMYKINCASLPPSLLDNELFGHDKGAYTGADSTFKGIFERANKSSLFLDEIGDMSLEIQSKILRTLQNHEIRRLGGKETLEVDVRFIAATNKDIQRLMEERKFREDLFYRLNAAMLNIPPLRDRKEDIPLLMNHFLDEFSQNNSDRIKALDDSVMEFLIEHTWPGNIRELKNVINYAATISNNYLICVADLPPYLANREIIVEKTNIREGVEKNQILEMLQKTKYNKKKAAELLNISRRTLYNKMEKYAILK